VHVLERLGSLNAAVGLQVPGDEHLDRVQAGEPTLGIPKHPEVGFHQNGQLPGFGEESCCRERCD